MENGNNNEKYITHKYHFPQYRYTLPFLLGLML